MKKTFVIVFALGLIVGSLSMDKPIRDCNETFKEVRIYNVLGEEIDSIESDGIYIIKTTKKGKTTTRKFIKK